MSLDVVVLVLATAAGVGAVIAVVGRPTTLSRRHASIDPGTVPRLVASLAAGLLVLGFSGWLVPSVIVAGSCWYAIGAWQRRDRRAASDVERTDALASWIENLRDVLVAGDQPVGAIAATVSTTPTAIRPHVRRLAAGLGRQDPAIVFRRFADDLDDPLGDLVAAGLLIAIQRGARTAAVLGSLAEQARHQADRRRLVEAERAPVQREVTLLTLMMGSLVVGLLVFGRADYLAAYDTPAGQLFLGGVLTLYALLLLRVQRLARTPRPSRFLTSAVGAEADLGPSAVRANRSEAGAR